MVPPVVAQAPTMGHLVDEQDVLGALVRQHP